MRRIRQGVATEAYWASTVRERNEAGADAAALECNRIYELKHQRSDDRAAGRSGSSMPSAALGHPGHRRLNRLDDPPGLDARGAGWM